MNSLDELVSQAQAEFSAAADAATLENAKANYLGKTGKITAHMKALSQLEPEQRKAQGAVINAAKDQIENALNQCRDALAQQQLQARPGKVTSIASALSRA